MSGDGSLLVLILIDNTLCHSGSYSCFVSYRCCPFIFKLNINVNVKQQIL